MSFAAVKTDAQRTAVMLDLLHRCYESGRDDLAPPYVVIEQVSPGTGWGASRYADVVALSTWPSRGLRLEGFEIKASRADLKRELADPGKHRAVARYCDEWSLVIWSAKMLEGLDVPADWGIMVVDEAGEELREIRKAAKREPDPWPRHFVCSLVRNAHMQSPRAAFVARAVMTATKQARKDAEHVAGMQDRFAREELAEALGLDRYSGKTLEELVELAAERLKKTNGRQPES